ncbi:acetyl-CoA carboxylase biotin carboxylase subunit [Butyricicoccus porcorum]|uniref:Biotin carboxylase n=1 Tax=Butyricicoccus porcorum TaxID=1945634 RepID=A0A252F6N0_9FIRM|nr:acetyl-CoA carboxylase biotin carboxylase subunit [Butyricicoccus porcorum]MCI6927103.1 acetyl-CoA carboxylase biotin carboxylase subunit [Butyricicoccus porcorum]MDD6986303.1 acetyl-CoA carboxylase biotin carboxylase subunit [Butyricicoccus porcorum]MDY4483606.1 acetyl-CoA carboxylase biotin carboxylase subunit [Butyricicoccus porcorum]OUM21435.1 acetyl-CoA carboxylase biotin carboxylase subunit [Butyricicoccus porcorum]
MFTKVLIANRGEIAVRVIRACRDLGILSVAVYSEADKEALHAQIADEAVCIGPAPSKDSYLNISNIIEAAIGAGAQAIHPGYGFLSENADFARACAENGLVFIGPKEETIRALGDKTSARDMAREAGVPLAEGSDGIVETIEDAAHWAEKIGYPVMLKASAGGGGKGIRVAEDETQLKEAFESASSEAVVNFGDGRLYMEKFISKPRHIEVQVLGDNEGNVIHLYDRECSIQRRHQKLIEEAPSPFLDEEHRRSMCDCAVRLAKRAGYVGAGTVEFLVDSQQNFYFCEMNTRIQVEHPITEAITGIDLVAWQLRIASGEKLDIVQEDVPRCGHAIECRINAEDAQFRPQPGTLQSMHLAGGAGVRVDTAVYQGYTIPPFYDSMIGKLIAFGCDRAQALARMKRALSEMLFEGIVTNTDYQLSILLSEAFETAQFHTNSIEDGTFDTKR